ncbi:MAG TPA: hypothetical protein VFP33_00745 [Gallionella sp.]|nr:hypothetical protein [Gallionella sp.]
MKSLHQKGFSLVSAIFLLVVVAALGAFAVTISTTQNQSQSMDLMGSRAYQAARAGIEWAAFNVANGPVPWAGCPAAPGAPVAMDGNLAVFTVTVTCVSAPFVEGGATVWVYDVTSTAVVTGAVPGSPDYVERQLNARLGG